MLIVSGAVNLDGRLDGQCDKLVTADGHQFITLTVTSVYNTARHCVAEDCQRQQRLVFTARHYASAVYAVIVCPSVCHKTHKSEFYKTA